MMVELTGYPRPPVNYELEDLYGCRYVANDVVLGRRTCLAKAAGTLHGDDGAMTPGGYFCQQHGAFLVAMFAGDNLVWHFRPFDRRPTG